uniref:Uncharacterized protein n=1 Tax=Zooxanthella nutricula TaxID=1333877 RepID=A0A7S2N9X3_9DINO
MPPPRRPPQARTARPARPQRWGEWTLTKRPHLQSEHDDIIEKAIRGHDQRIRGKPLVGVSILRPKPDGFHPSTVTWGDLDEMADPTREQATLQYISKANSGALVSQVFYRWEGKTPWKSAGDITHDTGNFAEAIVTQRPLIVEAIYNTSKISRYHLAGPQAIQLGYANENAEIVTVRNDVLAESIPPRKQRLRMYRCGFYPAAKPWEWLDKEYKFKVQHLWSRINKDMDRPLMTETRIYHPRIDDKGLDAQKNFNPHKYRGRYRDMVRRTRKGRSQSRQQWMGIGKFR